MQKKKHFCTCEKMITLSLHQSNLKSVWPECSFRQLRRLVAHANESPRVHVFQETPRIERECTCRVRTTTLKPERALCTKTVRKRDRDVTASRRIEARKHCEDDCGNTVLPDRVCAWHALHRFQRERVCLVSFVESRDGTVRCEGGRSSTPTALSMFL